MFEQRPWTAHVFPETFPPSSEMWCTLAHIEMGKWTGIRDACVATHIMFNGDNTSIRSDEFFNVVKTQDAVSTGSTGKGDPCCLTDMIIRDLRGIFEGKICCDGEARAWIVDANDFIRGVL